VDCICCAICSITRIIYFFFLERFMKPDIHPKTSATKFKCACGNVTTVLSVIGGERTVEVCSNCHPFYTGKAKLMDTAGRIEKFRKRYAQHSK